MGKSEEISNTTDRVGKKKKQAISGYDDNIQSILIVCNL